MSGDKVYFIVHEGFLLVMFMLMGYMGFVIRDKDPCLGLGIFSGAAILFLLHLHKLVYRLYYWAEYKEPSPMTREQKIAFFVKILNQRRQQ